jgi:hypothetical protein
MACSVYPYHPIHLWDFPAQIKLTQLLRLFPAVKPLNNSNLNRTKLEKRTQIETSIFFKCVSLHI